MKRLADLIEKYPMRFIGVILAVPLLLAGGMYFPWFSLAKGEANAWIGFWGSYLGGLVSGIITFAGVYFGFKLHDDKQTQIDERKKMAQILEHYADVYEVYQWCDRMLKYLDGDIKWNSNEVAVLEGKVNDSYKVLLNIDVDWYQRFRTLLVDGTVASINYYGLEKIMEADKGRYRKLVADFRRDIVEYIKIKG